MSSMADVALVAVAAANAADDVSTDVEETCTLSAERPPPDYFAMASPSPFTFSATKSKTPFSGVVAPSVSVSQRIMLLFNVTGLFCFDRVHFCW